MFAGMVPRPHLIASLDECKRAILWSINVIHINEKLEKLARRKPMGKFLYRKDSKGTPYYWLTTDRSKVNLEPNTDIWALENNYISLTPLCLDMTDKNYLKNIFLIYIVFPYHYLVCSFE